MCHASNKIFPYLRLSTIITRFASFFTDWHAAYRYVDLLDQCWLLYPHSTGANYVKKYWLRVLHGLKYVMLDTRRCTMSQLPLSTNIMKLRVIECQPNWLHVTTVGLENNLLDEEKAAKKKENCTQKFEQLANNQLKKINLIAAEWAIVFIAEH